MQTIDVWSIVRSHLSILLILSAILWVGSAQADRLDDAQVAVRQKDYAAAIAIWSELHEAGDASATFLLGTAHLHGVGTTVDVARGLRLIRKAADAGDAPAQAYLGFLYNRGWFVQQSGKLAWYWTEQAAFKKDGFAQLALGDLYWARGNKSDRIAALMWVELALQSIPTSNPQRVYASDRREMFRSMMSQDDIYTATDAALKWNQKNP